MLRVGLTGGIASGKSTVRSILERLGCATLDADALVSELYRPGRAGHTALVGTYGDVILSPDGSIDRAKLSAVAFASDAAAQRLNALIHPIVLDEIERIAAAHAAAGVAIFVVEATLLLEAGGASRFDRMIVVDVPHEVQVARAIERGLTRAETERRMAHQLDREERLKHADYVIDNSGDRASLESATSVVYARLERDAAEIDG